MHVYNLATGEELFPSITRPDGARVATLTSVPVQLNVTWNVADAVSGVDFCKLRLGTAQGAQDLLPYVLWACDPSAPSCSKSMPNSHVSRPPLPVFLQPTGG